MILGLFLTGLGVAKALAQSSGETRWGELTLEGSPEVTDLLPPPALSGNPIQAEDLDRYIKELLLELSELGYPFAEILPRDFDVSEGRVSGALKIELGARPTLAGIVLKGAEVTKPNTVMRLGGVKKGELFRGSMLQTTREKLLRSGLFQTVGELTLEAGPSQNEIVFSADAVEPAYTRFAGVLGVGGPDSKLTGLLRLELLNIAGTAREGAAHWENQGQGITRFSLSYREPWLPILPVGVSGALRNDVNEGVYSYTNWELRGDLSAGSSWRFGLGWGGARAVNTGSSTQNERESFVLATVVYDGRNSFFVPTQGARLRLESRRGDKTRELGSGAEETLDRTRWKLDLEGYQPLGNRLVLAAESAFEFLDTPEDSLPRYDQFAIGGANTLRGYREEQFLTSGALTLALELRWLQDAKGSALYGFIDQGWISSGSTAAERDNLDRYLLGLGVGLRQASPVGLLGVEYGIPKGSSPLDGRIHFRLDAFF